MLQQDARNWATGGIPFLIEGFNYLYQEMVQKLLVLALSLHSEHLLGQECALAGSKMSLPFLRIAQGEREVDEDDVCSVLVLVTVYLVIWR